MGYCVERETLNTIFQKLSKEYDIYAPKRFPKQGRYSDTDIIRYDKIETISEIVFDKKSDYPAKEILTPITQSLFYFIENEWKEREPKQKKILLFLRPCDIHAMDRQNKIYLQNGGFTDNFYKKLYDTVKIALIECTVGWDTCFCVSMGTNKTEQYDIAIRNTGEQWLVKVKDDLFKEYFTGEETYFDVEFIQKNELQVQLPYIPNKTVLNQLKKHTMWEEYNHRCISCGACTTCCPTCTCFTTRDILYWDNTQMGERRRTQASCQIVGFTDMAGGHSFRNTAGERMRYKVLHKFYDYKLRFKDHNMCIGCGRCIDRCPQYISIVSTVDKINCALSEIQKEGE